LEFAQVTWPIHQLFGFVKYIITNVTIGEQKINRADIHEMLRTNRNNLLISLIGQLKRDSNTASVKVVMDIINNYFDVSSTPLSELPDFPSKLLLR
jgi:hypothetical protein